MSKNPSGSLNSQQAQNDLPALRNQLLNTLLIIASIIGIPLYLVSMIPAIQNGLVTSSILYSCILIWVLLITFFRQLPYWIRAGSISVFPLILGILNLSQSGLNVDSGLFLLTFIILTGLLLGLKAGYYAMGAGALFIAGVGFLVVTNQYEPTLLLPQDDPMLWIVGGTVFILVGFIVNLSITTILQGLSTSLEKTQSLAQESNQEREELKAASATLERRLTAIRTAAEVSRTISGVLEPKQLLQNVVGLLEERFKLYYVGVFLVDERKQDAILEAGSGEAGRMMTTDGHKLPLNSTSMVGWTITNRQARVALDVGQEAVRFANPLLPLTRTELALPIISGDRALGALTIQSDREAAFDPDDITALQGIADTLAIALENARLFRELAQNLSEFRNQHGQYLSSAWSSRTQEIGHLRHEYAVDDMPSGAGQPIEVPLTLREQVIGQISLERNDDWSPDDRILIDAVATQAALALENSRLLEDTQEIALRERLRAEIANKIWASQNMDSILQTTVRELGRALRADEAIIELDGTE